MKILSIACILFWFTNTVTVVDSTKQEWKGGQGKSEGVNYKISFIVKKSSKDICLTSVKINNIDSKYKVFKNNKPLKKDEGFSKNDTLILSTSIIYKVEDRKKVKHPDNVNIYYTYKGKEKQIEINEFVKLKSLMYP
jgi:hypothetical protein